MSGEDGLAAQASHLSLDDQQQPPQSASHPSQPPPQSASSGSSQASLLKVLSKDSKEFTIVRSYAMMSSLIRTSLESDSGATELSLPMVRGEVLAKVIDYMNHHKGQEPPCVEKPLRSRIMAEVCKDRWDADFIDRIGDSRALLYDVILASNYLDLKSLLHLGCAKVASLVKGQPLEKFKSILEAKPQSAASSDTASLKNKPASAHHQQTPAPAAQQQAQ